MHALICWIVFTTHLAQLGSCCQLLYDAQQQPISTTLSLRNATVSDAEPITTTILAAFNDSPYWKYSYQFMEKYPRDHHDCLYEAIREVLRLPDALIQVVLLPNITKPHEPTVIAAALWALPTIWRSDFGEDRALLFPSTLMLAKCENRDQNLTRVNDFNRQLNLARKNHLDNVYARRDQMYLNTLATHPDYQRRGAGGALVDAGVMMGKDAYQGENVAATLIATVIGEPLYLHLGWKSLHNFTVRSLDVVEGSREEWRFDIMAYELWDGSCR